MKQNVSNSSQENVNGQNVGLFFCLWQKCSSTTTTRLRVSLSVCAFAVFTACEGPRKIPEHKYLSEKGKACVKKAQNKPKHVLSSGTSGPFF